MNKFTVKDLVNASVFSVLTLLTFWCAGMIGLIPVLMPLVPFICGFVSAPVFMLYSTKINKFGMVLILGILTGLLFSLSGHGVYVMPGSVIIALLAELVMKSGSYKSIFKARLAYTVFLLVAACNLLPMYIARESYIQKLITSGYTKEFVDRMLSVMPIWTFIPISVSACLGAYLGTGLGVKLLEKHFKKAGMA